MRVRATNPVDRERGTSVLTVIKQATNGPCLRRAPEGGSWAAE